MPFLRLDFSFFWSAKTLRSVKALLTMTTIIHYFLYQSSSRAHVREMFIDGAAEKALFVKNICAKQRNFAYYICEHISGVGSIYRRVTSNTLRYKNFNDCSTGTMHEHDGHPYNTWRCKDDRSLSYKKLLDNKGEYRISLTGNCPAAQM